MGSHIEVHGNNSGNIWTQNDSMKTSASNLMQKIGDGLTCRMAKVIGRSDDCTEYVLKFGSDLVTYRGVLAFDKAFYSMIGYPKFGDTVTVVQNDGNNCYILFTSNNKSKDDPVYYGSGSAINNAIAPCIAMCG